MDYDVLDRNGSVILSVGRERTPGICDETCLGCAYQGTAGSTMCCDHLLITHERRGCPAGAGCTRRKAGKKLMSLDAKVYLLPPEKTEVKTTVRVKQTPEETAEIDRERHRRSYYKVKAKLAGRQRAALVEFKQQTGHTNRTMALAVGVSVNTVNGWMQESKMADWKRLEHIGCARPEGL